MIANIHSTQTSSQLIKEKKRKKRCNVQKELKFCQSSHYVNPKKKKKVFIISLEFPDKNSYFNDIFGITQGAIEALII